MGDTLRDHLWAHLARVTIVAEIPKTGVMDFWADDEEQRRPALRALAAAGAEILVTRDVPSVAEADGWKKLGETGYFYLPLRDVHR